MGLSEEEQLKLALELSMQGGYYWPVSVALAVECALVCVCVCVCDAEQCVEECPMDQQPSSRDCAEPEAPTPDAQKPEVSPVQFMVVSFTHWCGSIRRLTN